jgi:hypothetical protein
LDRIENSPEINPGKATLFADTTRGIKPKPPLKLIEFEPGREVFLLEIPLDSVTKRERYDLRIRKDSGGRPLSIRGLERQEDGFLRMNLKRQNLKPGRYDVEVIVPRDDGEEERVVGEFLIEIVHH